MIRRLIILILLFMCGSAAAQNWTQVFSSPAIVTSAYFFNEFEGAIGTGRYESGAPAQIYYTIDGGSSWTRSVLPNPSLIGQVTDIFFRDRFSGWAGIKEYAEHGWSGLYHTSDGGRTWQLVYQADFIVGVRETSKGIYYTDRLLGVYRSINGGQTFQQIIAGSGVLGIDFMDDNIGIVTSEGSVNSPLLLTSDGGNTWTNVVTDHESWTPYADPFSRTLFYSSEHDTRIPAVASAILHSADTGKVFSTNTYDKNTLTGGIAGPRGCRSVVYVQGQGQTPGVVNFVAGLLRSTDGGNVWVPVGGPSNINDSRFAVTGGGAVVFAFDKLGGVWRTRNGGDGKLTSSVFPVLTISRPKTTDTIRTTICDSTEFTLRFSYSECDSLLISQVALLDDIDRELKQLSTQKYFGKNGTTLDSLLIRYKPKRVGIFSERIRIRFKHTDGSFEDTIMSFIVETLPTKDKPQILEGLNRKAMDFGTHSICGGDSSRLLTIVNTGCAPMTVTSLISSNSAFTFLSTFQPFILDAGSSRKFLIRFKPSSLGVTNGTINVVTQTANDSLSVFGFGIEGPRNIELLQQQITSSTCDSTDATFILRNTSCSDVLLDSLSASLPFSLLDDTRKITIPIDSFVTFNVRFKTGTSGIFKREIRMYSTIASARYDSVLYITGSAVSGAASVTLSTNSLDFGNVSTCAFKELKLIVTNSGCGDLTVNTNTIDVPNADFSFRRNFSGTVLQGNSDTIIIRLSPQSTGAHNTILHINTSAGVRDVTLTGIGTNDPGILTLSASSIPQILTCNDTTLSVTLTNTTCDSIIFDSLLLIGVGRNDYILSTSGFTALDKGNEVTLRGLFTPQAGGDRSATIHFYFHSLSGVLYDVTALLDGSAIAPSPVIATMPIANLSVLAGGTIRIPIEIIGMTSKDVASIIFSFECNADVFTPTRFDADGSYSVTTKPTLISSTTRTFDVTMFLPSKTLVHAGTLGEIVGTVYISDTLSTIVSLRSFVLNDIDSSVRCVPASFDNKQTAITLDLQCGDSILSKFMAGEFRLSGIASLSPNPTTGIIHIELNPNVQGNESEIIVYDALGIKRETHRISAEEVKNGRVEIVLDGAAGLRYIKLCTPHGNSVSRVILVK